MPRKTKKETAGREGCAGKNAAAKAGSCVRIAPHGINGTVLSVSGDSVAVVSDNGIRLTVKAKDVLPLKAPKERWPAAGAPPRGSRFDPVLDLHGKTAEEARASLETFLDKALLAGCRELRIIHGKGTGVLKSETIKYLKQNSHVALVIGALPGEGGGGATVAILK
ncbi:MAG: Smr/MutS family protein [Abditibacteriota bacterium]|nr:Smr/MutS family protein [Abditibacteriota bacterium]